MPDEITVTWRDSGKPYRETFDAEEGIEIAVDGPSVIRIGTDPEPLDDVAERTS